MEQFYSKWTDAKLANKSGKISFILYFIMFVKSQFYSYLNYVSRWIQWKVNWYTWKFKINAFFLFSLLNINNSFIKYEVSQWINKYLPTSELLYVKKCTKESKVDYYIIKYFSIQVKTLTDNHGLSWMSLISVKVKV